LVQEALSKLMKGRTVFAIAHRLSTVVDSDRILVLKGDRIIKEGPHEALMARDGYYASLVRRQTRGLLPGSPLIAEPGPRTLSDAA
jgi:ATP-binding cassette subfamily B protein